MKKLLLILFSFFLVFACIEKKTEIESNEQDNKETIQVLKVIDTIYPDGTHYVGGLKNNRKTGKGNCIYANGNTYIGEYDNNLANGQGTYIGTNGDSYIGKWQDNKPNGQGIYTWGEGSHYADVYVGEFKDGSAHGQGTYTWGSGTNKGDEYIGEFIDNKKIGNGRCTYANGDIYVGSCHVGGKHGNIYDKDDFYRSINSSEFYNWVVSTKNNFVHLMGVMEFTKTQMVKVESKLKKVIDD